jgi:hypothetical protein
MNDNLIPQACQPEPKEGFVQTVTALPPVRVEAIVGLVKDAYSAGYECGMRHCKQDHGETFSISPGSSEWSDEYAQKRVEEILANKALAKTGD